MGTIRMKVIYITDDGREFDSEIDAKEHAHIIEQTQRALDKLKVNTSCNINIPDELLMKYIKKQYRHSSQLPDDLEYCIYIE